jgi:hypothetical protein
MKVWSGDYIDAMELFWEDERGNVRSSGRVGGGGGRESTFIFEGGEHIKAVSGKTGDYVDSLMIATNLGRTMRWGGSGGKRSFEVRAAANEEIHGFYLNHREYIYNLAVYRYWPAPRRSQALPNP